MHLIVQADDDPEGASLAAHNRCLTPLYLTDDALIDSSLSSCFQRLLLLLMQHCTSRTMLRQQQQQGHSINKLQKGVIL